MRKRKAVLAVAVMALVLSGCEGRTLQKDAPVETAEDYVLSYDGIAVNDISSKGVAVHDPSILKAGNNYYIYGSHMTAAKSTDLVNWEMIADKYMKSNPVYGQIYDVADEAFAYAGDKTSVIKTDDNGTHVWAPDVIYNKVMGKYCMYYCTSSTWNASNLCFGISDSPEGPFVWQKALIYSGFNSGNIDKTDVLEYVDEKYAKTKYIKGGGYNYEDYPNAIDPTVFYDKDDRMWMVYGSWSGGIFLLELDPETGDVIHPAADEDGNVDPYFGKRLLGGGHISIEGPYILYDPDAGYYYLFVSYGALQSNGGYQMRVFRSDTVDGDYVDMNGVYPQKSALHQDYGLKLSGNYKLPSLDKAYMATGHNSAFIDDDGKRYVVYHTRFNDKGENHSPRVHQYFINEQGWPCELPYQTQGEEIDESGYEKTALTGRYFVTNQGKEISNYISNPVILYLYEDGSVSGRESEGLWEVKNGSAYMNITIDGVAYSGVFCAMKDEAGTDVMTFSAVGDNTTVWGVKY
ncbi:MAG: glycoside hydrolase family 43 protein [Lachnospiraceae bacterium]|nr:glycoside hydrolase family 43 protein [Lachnospiraceae bacterium]